jgi:hypothetical protein
MMLELDQHPGLESFYIFASSRRSPKLETMQLEVALKSDPSAQAFRDFAIATRGIVVAKQNGRLQHPVALPSFDHATFTAESMLTISLGHL